MQRLRSCPRRQFLALGPAQAPRFAGASTTQVDTDKKEMSAPAFGIALALAAALLALWIDVRFDSRRPGSALRRLIHAVLACVALQIVTMASTHVTPTTMLGVRLAALYGLLLPSLVYGFLSGLW